MRTETVRKQGRLFARDRTGDRHPGEVYAQGAKEVLAAWQGEGALDRRMPLPAAGDAPAPARPAACCGRTV
ncbi:hypothetical protein [Streptomyces sp. NPDC048357]|uniref:hypothetical protein n=1 Tax=Streptomyces sp. NPDC048357 TaxID=3154719 RepID=UPI0034499D0D